MARFHIAASLGAAAMALLVTLQLISHFGLSALDFTQLTVNAWKSQYALKQYFFKLPHSVEEETANGKILYTVGVGKADITGFGL